MKQDRGENKVGVVSLHATYLVDGWSACSQTGPTRGEEVDCLTRER